MTQYLYLIKCKSSYQEFYKVGIASDVEARLAQLQTGNPLELSIEDVYEFDNAEIVERAIHQAWKGHRIRGEWFEGKDADTAHMFQIMCDMLGGKCYVPDNYEVDDDDIAEAEEISESIDGGKWDFAAMFADGWRVELSSSRGKNGVYWAWRKPENGKRLYIYGGLVSDLPYPVQEMKLHYGKDN